MKTLTRLCLCALLFAILLAGCAEADSTRQVRSAAESFSSSYFSCRYVQAATLVTPACLPRLRFVASQLTEEDIHCIRTKTEPLELDVQSASLLNDSTAEVLVEARNFMQPDTLGRPCRLVRTARFTLLLRRQADGQWLVDAF